MVPLHGTFSRHGKAQASLALLIWLNEIVISSEYKFTRFIFMMCKPLIFFNSSFFSASLKILALRAVFLNINFPREARINDN